MTTPARVRRALIALESRRLELEKLIADDLERKFLSIVEDVVVEPTTTGTAEAGLTMADIAESGPSAYSTITWIA